MQSPIKLKIRVSVIHIKNFKNYLDDEILPFITDNISVFDRLRVNNTKAGSLLMSIALKVISAIVPSDREADCSILKIYKHCIYIIILNL